MNYPPTPQPIMICQAVVQSHPKLDLVSLSPLVACFSNHWSRPMNEPTQEALNYGTTSAPLIEFTSVGRTFPPGTKVEVPPGRLGRKRLPPPTPSEPPKPEPPVKP